jgi:hypothetical protein
MYVVKGGCVCVFLLFLLDGLWPVGAVVDVVEEAVDVLYVTQLLTVRTPAFFIVVIHPLMLVSSAGSKAVVHILCCCFLSVHNNLQTKLNPKLNSLAQTSNSKTIAFSLYIYLVAKTQTQPTTLVRIRSRTVLHHYIL